MQQQSKTAAGSFQEPGEPVRREGAANKAHQNNANVNEKQVEGNPTAIGNSKETGE